MMRPAVILVNIAAISIGIAAGTLLRPTAPNPSALVSDEEGDDSKVGVTRGAQTAYAFKLGRPFVIPVVSESRTEALLVLSVSLRTDRRAAERMASLELKLRDRMMATLLSFVGEERLSDAPLSDEDLETLRRLLLKDAQNVSPDDVTDILITEVAWRPLT